MNNKTDVSSERTDRSAEAGSPQSPEPGWSWREVCEAQTLLEGGDGVRFEVPGLAGPRQAFVVRFDQSPRAFLNQCMHIPVELDWQPGRFFDLDGLYLVCATNGATYAPVEGLCVAGPCHGRSLISLPVAEFEERVWVAVRDESKEQA
ncbi:MAG: Rieske (2Fe-2S) protein [Quisquiliibacterium sp.]